MTELTVLNKKQTFIRRTLSKVSGGNKESTDPHTTPLPYVNNQLVRTSDKSISLNQATSAVEKTTFLAGILATASVSLMSLTLLVGNFAVDTSGGLLGASLISLASIGIFGEASEKISQKTRTKQLLRMKQAYSQEIQEWAEREHSIVLRGKQLDAVVSHALGFINLKYIMDSETQKIHLITKGTDNTIHFEDVTRNRIPAEKTEALEAARNTGDNEAEAKLVEVKRKISILESVPLTPNDNHELIQAMEHTTETVKLVKKLQELKDEEYHEPLHTLLDHAHQALDMLIQKQRQSIRERFKTKTSSAETKNTIE